MQQIIEAYGPYAFGLVSLMVLWYTIVRPQLKVQEVQSNALFTLAASLSTTAETLRETSQINKEVIQELRVVVNDLRNLNHRQSWQQTPTHTQRTDSTGPRSNASQ